MSAATLPVDYFPDLNPQRLDERWVPTLGAMEPGEHRELLSYTDLGVRRGSFSLKALGLTRARDYPSDLAFNALEKSSPATIIESDEVDSTAESLTVISSEIDEMQSIVRDFANLGVDWDGVDSHAPSKGTIEAALVVLQNWRIKELIPEPEAGADGSITLVIYSHDGYTLGAIEFLGADEAVYSVNSRDEILGKGRFDTTSQTQIIAALSKFDILEDIS